MSTFRERNNIARKQCYYRDKERSEWLDFEFQVVEFHRKTYGHEVWHTSVIPEDELHNAGVIHDFNKHRLLRIARKREEEGKRLVFSDYGMDFLAKETLENGYAVYHAGQAKHYISRKVSGNDLGTFFLVVLSQVPNVPYLYTSGKLEVNLRENIQNMRGKLVHYELPFKPKIKEEILEETSLELRPYQIEAIDALMGEGRKVLEMACGMGKTLIAGHVLQRSRYSKIVCVAPLRVSVENLRSRLSSFVPKHRQLLVDSDVDGTTDVEEIREFVEKDEPFILFTTFKSAKELLGDVLVGDEFLIVDEVHNALNREDLCEFFNVFEDALFMSATIPEELYEMIDADLGYKYTMNDAIKNGFVCDYEVLLPAVVYNKEHEAYEADVDVPAELTGDLSAKALFLATGMLRTGSRRCIVYMRTCEECDAFIGMFKKIMSEYHAIDQVWAEKIINSVGSAERKGILKEFQGNNAFDLYILASVRILDEAIDIPKCDSEFITFVGEDTSDIRTVQRLSRGCRLDANNPNKKNHLFLWSEDWGKAIGVLGLLNDSDVEFHRKLRVMDGNYDKGSEKEMKERVGTMCEDLRKYVEVKCMTRMERWEMKRQKWIYWYEKLGRFPLIRSDDVSERRSGIWQDNMRCARKGQMKFRLSEEQIKVLDDTKGWLWEREETFEKNLNIWIDFRTKLGRNPSKRSEDCVERSSAIWQEQMRKAYRGVIQRQISEEQIKTLSNIPEWNWEKTDPFMDHARDWELFYNTHGRRPLQSATDKHEKILYSWQSDMRSSKKGTGKSRKLTKDEVKFLDSLEGWKWESYKSFADRCHEWRIFYETHGRRPIESSDHDHERSLFSWQKGLRYARTGKGINISENQIKALDALPGWKWSKVNN